MISRGEEFVAQQIILGRASSGPGWTGWALAAFREYESLDAAARLRLRQITQRLWADGRVERATLLKTASAAGQALLDRALCVYGHMRKPETTVDAALASEHDRTLGEAALWSSSVADFVASVFALPSELSRLVAEIARERQMAFPAALDLQDPNCLVTAAHTLTSLEQAIYDKLWPPIAGSTLSLDDARETMRLVLLLGGSQDRLARGIGGKALSSGLPSAALDGHELEVREFSIVHVPQPGSPLRSEVRDRMIGIVDDFLANPAPRQEKFGKARTAAKIVIGIGDEMAVARIIDWLADHPTQAGSLISDYDFESYAWEIDIRGRRRNLTLGYTIPLYGAPMPISGERRSGIEVFRPAPAKCGECGGKTVALFDVLFDSAIHKGLPAARRVYVLCCPKCAETAEGYSSRLRLDDRWSCDVDAWPCDQAPDAGIYEARRFVVTKPPENAREEARFGGRPKWAQDPSWPKCHQCHRRMVFMGQAGCTSVYYGFYCPDCQTTNVRMQYD